MKTAKDKDKDYNSVEGIDNKDNIILIKRALLSVSDKTGLKDFAKFLESKNVSIISTGGTLKTLEELKISVSSVENYTGFPEIFEGRLKTLHPKIHGGLLARRNVTQDELSLKENSIQRIDLLIVNLYPFANVISQDKCSFDNAIENIDIGGPAMLRAAAKNFENVAALCCITDYEKVQNEIEKKGGISRALRLELAAKIYNHTASYDSLIANYFNSIQGEKLPKTLTLSFQKKQSLRYGENPHQKAAYYQTVLDATREKNQEESNSIKISSAQTGQSKKLWQQLQGKELSYNNILDVDAAISAVSDLPRTGIVIIKHLNPCGAAINNNDAVNDKNLKDEDFCDIFLRAQSCDPISAFGSIIAIQGEVGQGLANIISKIFVEVIVATSFHPESLKILSAKKNLRLLKYEKQNLSIMKNSMQCRNAMGGLLYQENDSIDSMESVTKGNNAWQIVSEKKPDKETLEGMYFAWCLAKNIKSNAIVFSSLHESLGIGAGQMSRLDSVEIAISKARKSNKDLINSFVASDSFFPFRDGVDAIAKAGAKAIVHPGGSVKDEEIIRAANEHNLVMATTGKRHFLH